MGARTGKSVEVDVELLKQSVTVLERTVVSQNAAVNTELKEIKGVLREIHDKLDRSTLEHAVELVKQRALIDANAIKVEAALTMQGNEIARVESKITKASAALATLFVTVLGGALQWLTPGKP